MRYPAFVPPKAVIGAVAPSFGVSGYPYEEKYRAAAAKLSRKGWTVRPVEHLTGIAQAQSAPAPVRAAEWLKLYRDPAVSALISVAGGEREIEILPYLDHDELSRAIPKWFMGFSDDTVLTFTLPVNADVAAVYGPHLGAFGMKRWHSSVQDAFALLTGERSRFTSYPRYETEDRTALPGQALAGYHLTRKTRITSMSGKPERLSGRLTGGCLDVLQTLCGDPRLAIREYLERYREDGILWFLETCDLNACGTLRALWQLKQAGWFAHASGFLFGRPLHPETLFGLSYEEAVQAAVGDLGVPVWFGLDLGHLPPRWPIVSGALGTVEMHGERAEIRYEWR